MNKFAIIADGSCDLNEKYQKDYDIRIIPGHINYPDQQDAPFILKWENSERDAFYKALSKNPDGFSTAPPNIEEFKRVFTEYAEKGEDVLCITISGGISGACGFATQAKNEVVKSYPNARIVIVDSLRFKKGRLTHSKAFFGKLAGVKPIGEFDYNGLTTVIGKVKGAKKAYSVLLNYMENTIVNASEQTIFIAQTSRYPQAEKYKEMIMERFHPKEVIINDVFPSCGINIGPGLMAAYYIGTPISKGLTEEKALLERIISETA